MQYLVQKCSLVVIAMLLAPMACWCAPVSERDTLQVTAEIRNLRLHRDPAADEIVIDLSVELHLTNRGSNPLLVFAGDGWPREGAETLGQSRQEALTQSYVYSSSAWPSSDRPAWKATRRRLDQNSPPADLIRTIMPGESWTFDRNVVLGIQVKGSFDKSSSPWDTIRKIDPLWLQVRFMLWPNNLEQNMLHPKFGKELQRRWGDKGQLIIEEAVSEPLQLRLPPDS